MNHRLILKGKAWLRAVCANMALSGSWNVNASWPGFSEISKWTWRTVSEEITTKGLPMCGGDLHWGTAGPSAIPEWALRQVSRHSLVKQAASQWLWCLEMFTAELSRRRWGGRVSHPLCSPTSLWLLLEKSLDQKVEWALGDLGTIHSNCPVFSRCNGCWVYCLSMSSSWHMEAQYIHCREKNTCSTYVTWSIGFSGDALEHQIGNLCWFQLLKMSL